MQEDGLGNVIKSTKSEVDDEMYIEKFDIMTQAKKQLNKELKLIKKPKQLNNLENHLNFIERSEDVIIMTPTQINKFSRQSSMCTRGDKIEIFNGTRDGSKEEEIERNSYIKKKSTIGINQECNLRSVNHSEIGEWQNDDSIFISCPQPIYDNGVKMIKTEVTIIKDREDLEILKELDSLMESE
jgi:hypothetical protein